MKVDLMKRIRIIRSLYANKFSENAKKKKLRKVMNIYSINRCYKGYWFSSGGGDCKVTKISKKASMFTWTSMTSCLHRIFFARSWLVLDLKKIPCFEHSSAFQRASHIFVACFLHDSSIHICSWLFFSSAFSDKLINVQRTGYTNSI